MFTTYLPQNEIDLHEYINSHDALFHFCKPEDALSIIKTNQFILTPMKDLDDPFESAMNFEFINTLSSSNDQKKAEKIAFNIYSSKLDKMKTGSFCSNIPAHVFVDEKKLKNSNLDLKAWQRSRMWSQYAKDKEYKGHAGACLVFSRETLIKECKKSSAELILCSGISYRSKLKKPIFNCTQAFEKGEKEYLKDFLKEESNIDHLFFQKFIDYRDANEFRIGLWKKDNAEINTSASIKGIILGDKIAEELAGKFKEVKNEKNIEVINISFQNGSPKLTTL